MFRTLKSFLVSLSYAYHIWGKRGWAKWNQLDGLLKRMQLVFYSMLMLCGWYDEACCWTFLPHRPPPQAGRFGLEIVGPEVKIGANRAPCHLNLPPCPTYLNAQPLLILIIILATLPLIGSLIPVPSASMLLLHLNWTLTMNMDWK